MGYRFPERIAICGAGVMGRGIATACTLAGFPVIVYDIEQAILTAAKQEIEKNLHGAVKRGKLSQNEMDKALARITYTTDLRNCTHSNFIVEAIIEDRTAKLELFTQLESFISPHHILATNTSSISIGSLQAGLQHPERFLGLHFFNPAHIMKLVEIVRGPFTNEMVVEVAQNLCDKLGKRSVLVKDVPGFIVNRVARNFYNEALRIAEENIASYEVIDQLVKSAGFRMGPFELMDLIGIDTNFAVTQSIWEQYFYELRFAPSLLQKQYVEAKKHGRKTGEGFYNYR